MKGPAVEIDRIVRQVLAERSWSAADGATVRLGPATLPPCSAAVLTRSEVRSLPGKVITLSDVEGLAHSEQPLSIAAGAVISPLAMDYLKAHGIELVANETAPNATPELDPAGARCTCGCGRCAPGGHGAVHLRIARWGYAVVEPAPLAVAAVSALARSGTRLEALASGTLSTVLEAVTSAIRVSDDWGAVCFCRESALAVCALNQHEGIRAAAAESVQQVVRATETLGINVLVVEPEGKTQHELRGMMRVFCRSEGAWTCPPEAVLLLQRR